MLAASVSPPSPPPNRTERRAQVSARFLESLDAIVARHRCLAPTGYSELHAELIAAEVAHQLALVRAELARIPPLPPRDPAGT